MTPFLFIMACVGALASVDSFISAPTRFWANWLVWMLMLSSAGLGAMFLVSLEHVTGAKWSVPLRRTAERVSSLVFPASLAMLACLAGVPTLFSWAQPGWPKDPMQAGKTAWLNFPFFALRAMACVSLWLWSFITLTGGSLELDSTRDPKLTARLKTFSPAFLVIFGVTVTVVAFDWISSLSPEWYSDVFGVYLFAGVFLSGLSAVALTALSLKRAGRLPEVRFDHLYNLGGFLFAFVVFWSYIAFAQYMLIWYAHLPEETFWYKLRVEGPWSWAALGLAVIHFIIPFFALVTRDSKGDPRRLAWVSVLVLLSHYLDLCWLVFPSLGLSPRFSFPELGAALFFVSIGILWMRKALSRGADMPLGDPDLEEGLLFRLPR
ncbi:MAG: quinol:cytochrome C oxidoreductase [Elusimicrobia bacterium]|nr:quinol:cytochrome C oxidoreductase [Elusimicrobiota bacterium]